MVGSYKIHTLRTSFEEVKGQEEQQNLLEFLHGEGTFICCFIFVGSHIYFDGDQWGWSPTRRCA